MLIVMLWLPLYSSYAHEQELNSWDASDSQQPTTQKMAGQQSRLLRLEDVLSVEAGYRAFFAFCAHEFSSENAAFFARVAEFARRVESTPATAANSANALCELAAEARRLFDTFIEQGAPFEVNLSATHREDVRKKLERLENAQTPSRAELTALFAESRQGELTVVLLARCRCWFAFLFQLRC